MQLIFDGPAAPYGLTPESVLTLLPLAWWVFERFVRGKRATWLLPAASLILFSIINGIRFWDQWRIAHLPGGALHVTTGVIDESWHIVNRTRDWSQKSLSYRKTVSEGFDVAGVRFKWNVGDSYSPATFSNVQDPPVTFPKGTPVEVTWFTDDATDGERRILRLRLSSTAKKASESPDDLQAFVARFASALAAADPSALAAMTRFPFAFGAHTLERDEAPTLWTALRMPALHTCLARAAPAPRTDASVQVNCDGTVFDFRMAGDGRWQFVGIPQTR